MLIGVRDNFVPPPIHHLTGLRPVDASPGSSSFRMPASPWLQTPLAGYFPAGIMAWVADAPLGGSILSTLPPGKLLATSDLTMSYLRPPGLDSESLRARSKLIHAGRSLGLSEVTIEDGNGRLLGHGTSRCFLFDWPGPIPGEPEEAYETPVYDTPDPYLRRPVEGETLPAEIWDNQSGLDILRGFISGELPSPPIAHLTGIKWLTAEDGEATLGVPASPWLSSPAGTVYGGAIALIADTALTGAVQSTVPAATAYSPLDLRVNFLRPVMPDGRDLIARAKVIHRGRTLAVASGSIVNADGKQVAAMMGSTLILPDRPWPIDRPVIQEEEAGSTDE
jgi:uncharacterized protein (TIGR00369 family)